MSILYEFTKKSLVLHALPSPADEGSPGAIFLEIRKMYLADPGMQGYDDASVAKLADAPDLGSVLTFLNLVVPNLNFACYSGDWDLERWESDV
jgi:hypothetical protein